MKQEIFIEQPITIEATGDYHAFGAFVSSIAALPRIVTMHDFIVEAAPVKDGKSDIPVLNYSIKAKLIAIWARLKTKITVILK